MKISDSILRRLTSLEEDPENADLEKWAGENPSRQQMLRRLSDPEYLRKGYEFHKLIDPARPMRDMQNRIDRMHSRNRNKMIGWTAAAVAVGVVATLFVNHDTKVTPLPEAQQTAQAVEEEETIRPGKTMALLSTSTGESIALDETNSNIAESGQIVLDADDKSAEIPMELCLDVPRGGEFKIMLEDSTMVWLNSQSQLHYPEHFATNERRVEISGEAYFQVHKDAKRPFYVESNGQIIQVYGTTFNVKAYPDEEKSYTTLETGKISLRNVADGGEVFLKPGHQAVFDKTNEKVELKSVRTQVITGWRSGRFVFEGQPLKTIMRDISRWYDIEYEFTDPRFEEIIFMGSIPRYSEFPTVVAILEACGDIRFKVSGKKVTITNS